MIPHWKQLVSTLLIGCLIGAVIGSRSQRWAMHRFWQKGPNAERAFQRINKELKLDDKQQAEVRTILGQKHDKIMALHREMFQKFNEIRVSMRSEIRALLNPGQQEKFDAMVARWDAKHKREAPDNPLSR